MKVKNKDIPYYIYIYTVKLAVRGNLGNKEIVAL
jgi:hypothetical protein